MKKDTPIVNSVKFFFFDIESSNQNFQEMKKAMARGHYIKAAKIADFLLANHNNRRRKAHRLSREELCLCEIAKGIFSLRRKDFSSALLAFGSASGISQSDMRIKSEILLALVNVFDKNYKEARRRLKEMNSAILLKESMNGNQSVAALRYEHDCVRKVYQAQCKGLVFDNAHSISKTSKLFDVKIPV